MSTLRTRVEKLESELGVGNDMSVTRFITVGGGACTQEALEAFLKSQDIDLTERDFVLHMVAMGVPVSDYPLELSSVQHSARAA